MRVIINGVTGRMGKVILDLIAQGCEGATFVDGVSPDVVEETDHMHRCFGCCTDPADVVVDFSFHSGVEELLAFCKERKLPVVVATTGHTEEERRMIFDASREIPVFHSANMSLGIAVLAEAAKRVAAAFPNAEIEIIETHHDQKVDVPSGTALALARAIHQVRPETVNNIGRHENGKRTANEIGIHSLRIGSFAGKHEILISTGNETITLAHESHSRSLFGEGALKAAGFLIGKQPGLYTMEDMIS